MDILIAALLILFQHPEIAQDDDLRFVLIHSDHLVRGQIVVHTVIDRFIAALLGALVRRTDICRTGRRLLGL